MNVEIGTEAAQFPEKECINGIFLAVHKEGSAQIFCVNDYVVENKYNLLNKVVASLLYCTNNHINNVLHEY